ncbi:putative Metal dependent phosphohydrolase [Candidatus Sulfopaludibacter sp. SbA4]|nr:putative Metal dependent phosphohydrolase [Candidatus Sulfopaludibacter sp. SbA4]
MGVNTKSAEPKNAKASTHPPERLCKLPVFRPVTVQLLALLSSEDVDVVKVTELLNSDPAFSAEILTLANSSLYARQNRIDTVHKAVVVLGLERTRALAVTVALHGMVRGIKSKGAGQDCWRHSRATAIAARWLAPFYRINPEQAYTAGLMHDIGRLGMLSAFPEYPDLLSSAVGSNQDLLDQEGCSFSTNHCEAGLFLTRIWGLPEEFWDTASQHHAPLTGEIGDRTDLVRLSCLFAQSLGFKAAPGIDCWPPESLVEWIPQGALPRSRFSLEDLADRLQTELDGDPTTL